MAIWEGELTDLFVSELEEKRQKLLALGWTQAFFSGGNYWRQPGTNVAMVEYEAFAWLERQSK